MVQMSYNGVEREMRVILLNPVPARLFCQRFDSDIETHRVAWRISGAICDSLLVVRGLVQDFLDVGAGVRSGERRRGNDHAFDAGLFRCCLESIEEHIDCILDVSTRVIGAFPSERRRKVNESRCS